MNRAARYPADRFKYPGRTPEDPIFEAVLDNDKSTLLRMLQECEKEPSPVLVSDRGWTVLHVACSKPEFLDCLELLLFYGDSIFIDINARNIYGDSPLHILCVSENPSLMAAEYLVSVGIKISGDGNYIREALKYAVLNGRTELLQLILQSIDDWTRIECCDPLKVTIDGYEALLSLPCGAIHSGNLECLATLMVSNIPKKILQLSSYLTNPDNTRVFSPLAFLFFFSTEMKADEFNSFLHLLLQHDSIEPDTDRSQLYDSTDSLLLRSIFENPFSVILSDSWLRPEKQHYLNLLIANNVTSDYCLQRYHDISQPFSSSSDHSENGVNWYTCYYKDVLDAVQKGKVDVVKVLISNSAVLEPDNLVVHLWSCLAEGDSEHSGDMYQYLISLKPLYYMPGNRPSINIEEHQIPTHNEEFNRATLRQLCRTAIRQQLRGPTIEDNLCNFRRKILELPIPSTLKDYLLFKT